ETDYVWHFEQSLNDYDVVFLPGGFSYGDYIRSGRLAKFSPVVNAVKEYVKAKRGFVIGICNGFQILCESGLLPGVLTDNWNTRFICKTSRLQIKNGKEITLPIAHGEGRYLAEDHIMQELKRKDMIFLTYINNPNGSMEDIAGLYDRENNIIGMMPHPERAFFSETGSTDGREIFKIVEQALTVKK
ncbi:MAG: phosphoribosylformylglycinamidine synthase subunit PurQ, partial [Heliobacteriaceae bacterium]|nr:phosphoribosylformylglycinamidine synthase subunit PurQ [Heliobacteriaceae bacterium]